MKQEVLTDATEAELATAVEENLFALFRAMSRLPGGILAESEHLSLHHTFPANPMFKGVWRSRLEPDAIPVAVAQAKAWFRQQGADGFFWWTGPQTRPVDLAAHLQQHGFDGNDTGDPGMALDLRLLDESVPLPEGLTIKQATDEAAFADWCDVFVQAFDAATTDGQAWIDATIAAGVTTAPWQLFVAYRNEQPVGVSLLFCDAGAAGMYAVGTRNDLRRQGIGRAITTYPLLQARAAGYRYGVLFASRSGQPLYRQMGFRKVGCNIGLYYGEC